MTTVVCHHWSDCIRHGGLNGYHYWRAKHNRIVICPDVGKVSIHARHYWRAKQRQTRRDDVPRGFQSTPVITGGRNVILGCKTDLHALFQSTPVITGGRNAKGVKLDGEKRAFQSTPVITGGRNARRRYCQSCTDVSIHARHYWRAKLDGEGSAYALGLFQSTPVITGGRNRDP